MILRKPYAFLIKHFRLIHIILAFLAGFITYKYYRIIGFFNQYLKNNFSGNYYPGFSSEYIDIFVYLALIFILIGLAGMLILFIYKKKKPKSYILAIGYYILLFIGVILVKNTMVSIETNYITTEVARLYRDITMIIFIPQLPLLVLFVMQGLGINIDKYNFKQDLKNLEIENKDNEEFELTFKGDTVKLQRNVRRFFREFIYYVKENKFVFTIIAIITSIILVVVIYNNLPKNMNGLFNQGDYFSNLGINYKIQDSIVTNLDYNGDKINNKYYVVVKLYIENNSDKLQKLDFNRFRLEVNKETRYPIFDKGVYFIDYARNLTGSTIAKKSQNTYSLVYEISDNEIKKNYRIKIDGGLTTSKDEIVGKYNYVSINPVVIDRPRVEGMYDLGNEINFVSSNLKNTKLKLSNLEITDKYTYTYEFCTRFNKCDNYINQVKIDNTKNNTTLMVFDYTLSLDTTSSFYTENTSIKNIVENFAKVKYIENNEEKYADVYYVTPSNLNNKIIVETTNKVNEVDTAYLAFIIRNKEYLIRLK